MGKLREIKKQMDAKKAEGALDELQRCVEGDDNLMYPIVEAVKAYCTVGEICDRLREVFGTYAPPSIL